MRSELGMGARASSTSGNVVSAQVVVRPRSRERARSAGPVTSANIAEHLPSSDDVQRAQEWFRDHGFDVGAVVGTSFSIAAPPATFERTFKTRLRRSKTRGVAVDRADAYELPLKALPENTRKLLDAVTFTPPPAFGPTDFSR
jgi:hypothetical protein